MIGSPAPHRSIRPRHAAAWLGLAVAAALICSGGCYRRVISAQGFGSETIQTEEPYQESGEIDNWIFGQQKTAPRRLP